MTIWVIAYGFAVVRGEAHESVPAFAWRGLKVVIILAFALGAGIYQSQVVTVIEGATTGLAQTIQTAAANAGVALAPAGASSTAQWGTTIHHIENCVHLLYSKGGRGQARVTPADLIASTMRTRPDCVLLAELRGSEAYDFLKLLTTGHSGSITSYHASNASIAIERFALMAKEHPEAATWDDVALRRLLSMTIDVGAHIRRNFTLPGRCSILPGPVWHGPMEMGCYRVVLWRWHLA